MADDELTEPTADFDSLGLSEPLVRAVRELGYEAPTPIQAETIPPLLAGRNLIGQAQTGTGKTAAFALPLLDGLDLNQSSVQVLVLTPTRELAIQVAEAVHSYSKYLGSVWVLPVYGGQAIQKQLWRLQKGVHVVVGTPGRVMDHLRRGSLRFDALRMVILDEADEMLRMGFQEDVEWILGQAPEQIQVALFSATMPDSIQQIARRYVPNATTIEIQTRALTVPTIEQRYLQVSERNKLDALTRVLEVESPEAVLIFARTKVGAAELVEKLQARGYAAEAMHGDMSQAQREIAINRLRRGQSEIVVATDVAARGWDVEQISHVINYDVPHDVESYIHRIGRTGRAGREGTAILFVTPRQQRLLHHIERHIRRPIPAMRMPTKADVASRRMALFKEQILEALKVQEDEMEAYLLLVEELAEESGRDMAEIAAAAARLARGDKPLVASEEEFQEPEPERAPRDYRDERRDERPPRRRPSDGNAVQLFVDVGRRSGVRPQDIVGAIANEGGIPGHRIGNIEIFDRFTIVEVPAESADQILNRMADSSIRHRPANIRRATARDAAPRADRREGRGFRPGGRGGYRNRD